ncbi:MAG: efflux transporter outer membrane subunit [Chitinophagaceae bacterium]|nr:MAG: efflux transporter outer membrane subunit [Chitinophagaceae bacterium]
MKQLSSLVYILPFLLVLAACNTGRQYQRPEIVLQSSFDSLGRSGSLADSSSTAFTAEADTAGIAAIPWNQFFADSSLAGLISNALVYNHDLLVAIKRIDIAGQQLRQAKLLNVPSVNLGVSGQINRPSDNSLNGLSTQTFLQKSHVENYNAQVGISWEADIWGKLRARKEVALLNYLQTREAANAIRTQLVSDIAQGYYNLLMLDKQLEVARRNLALNDSFLTATRLLKDAGNLTSLAVQQAEAQKQGTALLIPALEQDILLQENALQLLAGQLPGKAQRSVTLTQLEIPEVLATGVPVAMVGRRPDVRAEEIALKVANKRVGIAQAAMYPSLNITAAAGLETFKASNWFNIPGSLFGLATGSLLQPVFQKRELRTAYEVAKLEREQAVIRFRQSVLIAGTEVSDALVQGSKLKEQQELASQQTNTLRVAVSNAQQLFRSDMAGYLEVITAQTNALQAELNLASIQRGRLSAMVELYRALGGGWK